VDLLYERGWGKRVINANWGAGLRYFTYEGNYPMAVWLRSSSGTIDGEIYAGYTNGLSMPLITMSQETTGIGPTGYGEIHFNFLRDRIQLFALARASFVLMDYETDSGEFISLVFDGTGSGQFIPAAARLQNSFEKDSWHTGLELGSRIRLAEGLQLSLSYHLSSYQDAVLLPNELSIPDTSGQINFGTSATYNTRDFKLDGWRAGFSFQY